MDQGQVSFLGYLRPLWTAAWSRADQRQEARRKQVLVPEEGQKGLSQARERGGGQGWLTRKANQAWRGGTGGHQHPFVCFGSRSGGGVGLPWGLGIRKIWSTGGGVTMG